MTATQGRPAWIITWDSYSEQGRDDWADLGKPGDVIAVLPPDTPLAAIQVAVDAVAQVRHFTKVYRPTEEYADESPASKAKIQPGCNEVHWDIMNPNIIAHRVEDLRRPDPENSTETTYTVTPPA